MDRVHVRRLYFSADAVVLTPPAPNRSRCSMRVLWTFRPISERASPPSSTIDASR